MRKLYLNLIMSAVLTVCVICSSCGKGGATDMQQGQAGEETPGAGISSEYTEGYGNSQTQLQGSNLPDEQDSSEESDDVTLLNAENIRQLLADLLSAAEDPAEGDEEAIQSDLDAIRDLSEDDYEIALAIADSWKDIFLDPDYQLIMYDGEEVAAGLAGSGIPENEIHAFVVLGYQLEDGEMTDELKNRCEAAAAAARAYPCSVLICSGGATGYNNPDNHTEAGMMKAYLTEECNIDPDRIYTDEKAFNTAENAANTFRILKELDITTLTIVTSSYHQRWGQALYNAVGALYRQKFGTGAQIISNYCYETEPEYDMFRMDARFAAIQLAEILQLPEDVIYELPQIPGYTPLPGTNLWS